MIKVFGHKAPDTDSTGSAIIWAWYLNKLMNQPAEAVLLGKPNTEAKFVLDHWGFVALLCNLILHPFGGPLLFGSGTAQRPLNVAFLGDGKSHS